MPHQLRIRLRDNAVTVSESLDPVEVAPLEPEQEGDVVYDLVSLVAHIAEEDTSGNLVSHIKVSSIYHIMKEGSSRDGWYIFNDFAITPSSPDDAVSYNLDWKVPCIMYYVRRDLSQRFPTAVNPPMDVFRQRLLHDHSLR